jgi:hypothetical protein
MLKRLIGILGMGLLVASMAAAQNNTAQSGASNQEMSVEESYLQQSVENLIIHEQSRAEGRDMKFVALQYIGDAISNGNTGPEVHGSLEYLALEGLVTQSRENGRLINNYPDVRRDAVRYLGDLGTPEAKKSLLKVVLADNEPYVLQEAVKSLGRVGNNDNGEVSKTISWMFKRFDTLNPDNVLAVAVLDAFETLLKTDGTLDADAIQTIHKIASTNAPYIKPVRDRAMTLLGSLRRATAENNSRNNTGNAAAQR